MVNRSSVKSFIGTSSCNGSTACDGSGARRAAAVDWKRMRRLVDAIEVVSIFVHDIEGVHEKNPKLTTGWITRHIITAMDAVIQGQIVIAMV